MRSRPDSAFLGSAECSGFLTEQPGDSLASTWGPSSGLRPPSPNGRRSGWSFSLGEKVSGRARTDEGPSGPMPSRSRQRFVGSAQCSGFVTEQPGESLASTWGPSSGLRPPSPNGRRSGWSFSLGEKVSRRAGTDEGPSGPMRSRSRQRFVVRNKKRNGTKGGPPKTCVKLRFASAYQNTTDGRSFDSKRSSWLSATAPSPSLLVSRSKSPGLIVNRTILDLDIHNRIW